MFRKNRDGRARLRRIPPVKPTPSSHCYVPNKHPAGSCVRLVQDGCLPSGRNVCGKAALTADHHALRARVDDHVHDHRLGSHGLFRCGPLKFHPESGSMRRYPERHVKCSRPRGAFLPSVLVLRQGQSITVRRTKISDQSRVHRAVNNNTIMADGGWTAIPGATIETGEPRCVVVSSRLSVLLRICWVTQPDRPTSAVAGSAGLGSLQPVCAAMAVVPPAGNKDTMAPHKGQVIHANCVQGRSRLPACPPL